LQARQAMRSLAATSNTQILQALVLGFGSDIAGEVLEERLVRMRMMECDRQFWVPDHTKEA
jgi:hypothetical protein